MSMGTRSDQRLEFHIVRIDDQCDLGHPRRHLKRKRAGVGDLKMPGRFRKEDKSDVTCARRHRRSNMGGLCQPADLDPDVRHCFAPASPRGLALVQYRQNVVAAAGLRRL